MNRLTGEAKSMRYDYPVPSRRVGGRCNDYLVKEYGGDVTAGSATYLFEHR